MELANFGTIALMVAFALCVYGTVVPHLGVRANNWNLVRSAQNATILTFFFSGDCVCNTHQRPDYQ
jgi:hypothetical protein